MSSFESHHGRPHEAIRTSAPAPTASDAMLRAIGALVLLGIGIMHFAQIVATFKGTPVLGGAYLVLIAACLVVAGRLVTHGDSWAWTAAGLIGVGAIAGYVFTRVASTPMDNQDVGNWSCMLGLAALFVETSLLAFSGYARATVRAFQRASGARVGRPRDGRTTGRSVMRTAMADPECRVARVASSGGASRPT